MKLVVLTLAMIGIASPAIADGSSLQAIKHARALCKFFDSNGFSSKPCSVNVGQSISVWLDASPGEAKKICGQVSAMTKEAKYAFDGEWKLNIYSPFSGSSTIAFCAL